MCQMTSSIQRTKHDVHHMCTNRTNNYTRLLLCINIFRASAYKFNVKRVAGERAVWAFGTAHRVIIILLCNVYSVQYYKIGCSSIFVLKCTYINIHISNQASHKGPRYIASASEHTQHIAHFQYRQLAAHTYVYDSLHSTQYTCYTRPLRFKQNA